MINRVITCFLHVFFLLYSFFHFRKKGENKLLLYRKISSGEKHIIAKWYMFPLGLKLYVHGTGNRIIIHSDVRFVRSSIMIEGNNATVEIFEGGRLQNLHIFIGKGTGTSISLGRHCTTESVQIIARGRRRLVVEDDCMFAANVLVRLSDSHPIRDAETGEVINGQDHPAVVGRHTWVGQNVCLTKNAVLAPDTVVGLGSVVCGVFSEEGTCLGGNPARVLRRKVLWTRALED